MSIPFGNNFQLKCIIIGICKIGENQKLQPLIIGNGIFDLATSVQILMTSICPGLFEMMKAINK